MATDEYTDLGDDWALIRSKLTEIEPELVDELLETLANLRQWCKRGENDLIRSTASDLALRLVNTAGPRKTVLKLAHMAATMIPFEIDDPTDAEEDFILRTWRTVEYGYTVMDHRARLDPTLRCFPRMEYSVSEVDPDLQP
jgi:hypothetical protein